jgi:zinc transporter
MNEPGPEFLYSYLLDGTGHGHALTAAEVQAWKPDQGLLWVHMNIADAESAKWLDSLDDLPALAYETLLAAETRPRSFVTGDGMLVVLRGVNTNPGADPEDMVAVRVWIDSNRIITSQRRRLLSIEDVARSLDDGKGPESPGEFLTALVERLADRIGGFVGTIEVRLDEAEDEIGKIKETDFRKRLGALRRQIAEVRRFLAPQRDALDRLTRQTVAWLDETDAHYVRQEADRITRFIEDLDLGRERAVVLQEELLSQLAHEQNARMYVLSIVAAVFLPLTFVTGLLGMNVGGLPGLESPNGFAGSLVVMVVAAGALLLYFRFRKWL